MGTRIGLPAVVFLLLANGCGGSSPAASKPSPPAKTTATSLAPSSPSPTLDIAALAQAFAGIYKGTWTNTTFGSSGPVTADIKVDSAAKTVTAVVTIGGNVFGSTTPLAPETFTGKIGDLASLSFSGHSPTFGDFTVTSSLAGFTMKATNLPGDRVDRLDVAGTLDTKTINAAYTVTLKDGSRAAGSCTLGR